MTDFQIYTLHSDGLTLGSHTLRSETANTARDYCTSCLPKGGVAEIWADEKRIDLIWITADSGGVTSRQAW